MSGALTLPGMTVSSTAPQINMQDTDGGYTRYLHVNGGLMGFLKTDGSWDMYMNNAGQMWTANYGWLHDQFAQKGTFHHSVSITGNCANGFGGTLNASLSGNTLQLSLSAGNCNCNCNCY